MHRFFDIVDIALIEDLGSAGDITSIAAIPSHQVSQARVISREEGVIAGLDYFEEVFHKIDPETELRRLRDDGDNVTVNEDIIHIEGRTRSLLSAERVALNFLGHLSGVATRTRRMVDIVKGTGTKILDTRKTTPGLRIAEKEAVRAGGGYNHRLALYDMVLIKENHISAAGGIPQAIKRAKEYLKSTGKTMEIEIEVRNMSELIEAVRGMPDRIMLDNFTYEEVRNSVEYVAGRISIEVSGGINETNIRKFAEAGPDYISVGGLTSSVKALDLSMLMEGL